ncbi:MAG: response regulator [bacterium]|nr:response regulator [bacterium]MDZ4296266.1 response regulator [Patescibacteria group bacterium]MDZ4296287.1 response regulator [Patescibacteria group bacterium]
MDKKYILLVEDDAFLAELYAAKFSELGYEIATAQDGKEGLRAIEKRHPDVVLLDIVLPKMDGLSVLKEIKSNEALKAIPVILLTNLGQKEDVERGLALGADAYIIKAHFTPTELVAKVEEVLQKGNYEFTNSQ